MRWDRMSVAGVVSLAFVAAAAIPGAAQDDAVNEEVLFEIVVPASAVPDPFNALYFEAETIDPGVDGDISARVENMRGRTLYVDAGELVLAPMTDAYLWRQEAALGGDPQQVPAGDSVRLTAGDLILLPAVPADELDLEGVIPIANPGAETAVTYGFHLCDGGGAPTWPAGMTPIEPAGGIRIAGDRAAPLGTEDAVVRLTRSVVEPGATVALDENATFGLYRLESGTLEMSFTSAANDERFSWTWEPGRGLPITEGLVDLELRATSDVPASMLALTGVEPPAASQ